MKTILKLAVCALLGSGAHAQLLTEHFDYPGGTLDSASSGNTVWTGGDSPAAALTVSPSATLENAALFGEAGKLYAGRGNQFYGCRPWENCDDGWDCYQTEYEIVLDHCWAWHNGDPSLWGFSSFSGDGNCFKLGGDNTYCPITVLNCVALDAQWGTTVGFAFNNNTAPDLGAYEYAP